MTYCMSLPYRTKRIQLLRTDDNVNYSVVCYFRNDLEAALFAKAEGFPVRGELKIRLATVLQEKEIER